MARRIKTLLFVLLLAGSVYSGTPFSASSMDDKVCPMKCCKKAKAAKEKAKNKKYFCRVLVCGQTIPTQPNTFSATSFVPVYFESTEEPGFDSLFDNDSASAFDSNLPVRGAPSPPDQPIFLKTHSLLI